MSTGAQHQTPARTGGLSDQAFHAFLLLLTAFTLAPVPFGMDKLFAVLTGWEQYLGPVHQ